MNNISNVKQSKRLDTAVLFLIFNRMDTTKLVFEQIKKSMPPRIYIASDGARAERQGEQDIVNNVRNYVLENIDWQCEVKTFFRDNNLGCGKAVSGAISWFFEHEDMGIILEDDCLPTQSFFWFCEELLKKYKYDMRVWHISGDNFQWGKIRGDGDYYFSKYNHVWGWATWADRWQCYDFELETLDKFKQLATINNVFEKNSEKKFWLNTFASVSAGKIDTWDYQWSYCMLINNGLSILPNTNLIKNIGFGVDATHTKNLESTLANIETSDISLPLKHPSFMLIDKAADTQMAVMQFDSQNLFVRIFKKLKSF